jgi:hypothetical protein
MALGVLSRESLGGRQSLGRRFAGSHGTYSLLAVPDVVVRGTGSYFLLVRSGRFQGTYFFSIETLLIVARSSGSVTPS